MIHFVGRTIGAVPMEDAWILLEFENDFPMLLRYRKFNLFAELGVQRPPIPEAVAFRTDFNVTFGIFICFDSLFIEPTTSLLSMGITNFVYPTYWFSKLPFLTGTYCVH